MHSVLFVCTANVCRSPMAMGLLMARLSGQDSLWKVDSAGTWALEGEPPAEQTLAILREHGIDLSNQVSKQVTRQLLESFNLVLVMERGHKEAMRAEFPGFARRIYLLSEMIGRKDDIRDPMGGAMVEFQATAREIERMLALGFEKIKELSDDSQG